jgi:hypothetical protein
MAMTIRLICGVLLSLGATGVFAQSAFPEKPSLELRLVVELVQAGLPQMFTFLLVNTSDHEIHVPGRAERRLRQPSVWWHLLKLTSPGGQGWQPRLRCDVLREEAILDRMGNGEFFGRGTRTA